MAWHADQRPIIVDAGRVEVKEHLIARVDDRITLNALRVEPFKVERVLLHIRRHGLSTRRVNAITGRPAIESPIVYRHALVSQPRLVARHPVSLAVIVDRVVVVTQRMQCRSSAMGIRPVSTRVSALPQVYRVKRSPKLMREAWN